MGILGLIGGGILAVVSMFNLKPAKAKAEEPKDKQGENKLPPPPAKIALLVGILEDKNQDPKNRIQVASVLLLMEKEAALPYLRRILNDKNADATVRGLIANAVGELKITEAVQDLLGNIEDSNDKVRAVVFSSLGALGQVDINPDLRNKLIGILEDKSAPLILCRGSVRALCCSSNPEAKNALLKALKEERVGTIDDEEQDLRTVILNTMTSFEAESIRDIVACLGAKDKEVKEVAEEILVEKIEDTWLPDELCKCLGDDDPVVRRGAVYVLGKRKEKSAEILKKLNEDTDDSVKTAAATALGEIGSDWSSADQKVVSETYKGLNAFVKAALDKNSQAVLAAQEAMKKIEPLYETVTIFSRGIDKVLSETQEGQTPDPEIFVQSYADKKEEGIKLVPPLAWLIKQTASNEQEQKRVNFAKECLIEIGNQYSKTHTAKEFVDACLANKNPLIRGWAGQVLTAKEDPASLDPIIELLSDEDELVRLAATRALEINHPQATAFLIQKLLLLRARNGDGFNNLQASEIKKLLKKHCNGFSVQALQTAAAHDTPAQSDLKEILEEVSKRIQESSENLTKELNADHSYEEYCKIAKSACEEFGYFAVSPVPQISEFEKVFPKQDARRALNDVIKEKEEGFFKRDNP